MNNKLIPVFLSIVILFGSFATTQNKAHANPLTAPLVVGGASAYTAVSLYVLAGLLVAGGAGVIGYENADEIKQHSLNVYNQLNQTTKSLLNTAIEESLALGKTSLTLSNQLLDSMAQDTATIGNYLGNLISTSESFAMGGATVSIGQNSSNFYVRLDEYNSPNHRVIMNGVTGTSGSIEVGKSWRASAFVHGSSIDGNNYFAKIIPFSEYGNQLPPSPLWVAADKMAKEKTWSSVLEVASIMGVSLSIIFSTSVAPPVSTLNDNFNQTLERLRNGAKEINIPIDKFIATGAVGATLLWDAANSRWLNPDGTTYTGDVKYDVPVTTVNPDLATPTYQNPTVELDNVNVGDTPFTNTPTTTAPPTTGDSSGILQGLWDWLKGILQSILDAVLSLASLVSLKGLLDLLQWLNPFADTFFLKVALVPSPNYFQNYWSSIYKMYSDKIPIIAQLMTFFSPIVDIGYTESIPEFAINLPEDLGGVKLPIIDFSYFSDYRTLILNFIRFIAWFIFLKRMLKYIPKVVY